MLQNKEFLEENLSLFSTPLEILLQICRFKGKMGYCLVSGGMVSRHLSGLSTTLPFTTHLDGVIWVKN